jgi:hypothetical protein
MYGSWQKLPQESEEAILDSLRIKHDAIPTRNFQSRQEHNKNGKACKAIFAIEWDNSVV